MDAEVTHEINIVQKDGYNFFNLKRVSVRYEIEGLKMKLNNLFNGAKQLGKGLIILSLNFQIPQEKKLCNL